MHQNWLILSLGLNDHKNQGALPSTKKLINVGFPPHLVASLKDGHCASRDGSSSEIISII